MLLGRSKLACTYLLTQILTWGSALLTPKNFARPSVHYTVFYNINQGVGHRIERFPSNRHFSPYRLQSISNPYIFRCSDGTLIDGKFHGISGSIFNSIQGRDRINGIDPMCDKSWLLLPRVSPYLKNFICSSA